MCGGGERGVLGVSGASARAPTQPRVRRELRAWRPTLVHAASRSEWDSRRARRPARWPCRSSLVPHQLERVQQLLPDGRVARDRVALPAVVPQRRRRTYCPTQAVQDELAARRFQHMTLWSRGVDSARFNPSYRSAALRARLGVTDDMMLAIYVGRLGAEKGLGVALRGMGESCEPHPGACGVRSPAMGYADEARKLAPEARSHGAAHRRCAERVLRVGDVFMFRRPPIRSATSCWRRWRPGCQSSGDVDRRASCWPGTPDDISTGDAADFARQLLDLVHNGGWRADLATTRSGLRGGAPGQVWDALVDDYCAVMAGVSPGGIAQL